MNLAEINRELNWNPREAAQEVHHSSHQLNLTTAPNPLPGHMHDEVLFRLSQFFSFNGGHNHIADVCCDWRDGVHYAYFDMKGLPGFLSAIVNGVVVAVRIWCDRLRGVHADTTGSHMLIGQRRWAVAIIAPDTLRFTTEAYERPRGLLNRMGSRFVGRHAQQEVWRAYLQNMNADLAKIFATSGAVSTSPVTPVHGNPWSPENPYPGSLTQCR